MHLKREGQVDLRLGNRWRFVSSVVSINVRIKFRWVILQCVDRSRVHEAMDVTARSICWVDVHLGLIN